MFACSFDLVKCIILQVALLPLLCSRELCERRLECGYVWQVTPNVVDISLELLKLLFIFWNWEVRNMRDFFSGWHDLISFDRMTKYFYLINHEIAFVHS